MGSDDGEDGDWQPAEKFEFPDQTSDSNDDDDDELDAADLEDDDDDQGACDLCVFVFDDCA